MEVRVPARIAALLILSTFVVTSGCQGFLAQLLYWHRGQLVPAEYDGLKKSRVAVVSVSDSSSYGTGTESLILAREVAKLLRDNVKGIQIVRPDEVADWIDKNGWDEVDYREIGRGVKADRVVAIDISGLRLYEGTALYKGRADVTVTVLDMTDGGREVFRKDLPDFRFPTTGPHPVGETSESQFRRAFLGVLAQHVARYFYSYDMLEDFRGDPASLGLAPSYR